MATPFFFVVLAFGLFVLFQTSSVQLTSRENILNLVDKLNPPKPILQKDHMGAKADHKHIHPTPSHKASHGDPTPPAPATARGHAGEARVAAAKSMATPVATAPPAAAAKGHITPGKAAVTQRVAAATHAPAKPAAVAQ